MRSVDDLEVLALSMSKVSTDNGYGIDNSDVWNRKRVKFSKEAKKFSYFLNNAEVIRARI